MYKIASINVNGIKNIKKRDFIFNWLKTKQYDVILLQQTHCTNDFESNIWANEWAGLSFWSHCNKASKGVGILIKSNLSILTKNISHLNKDGRFLSVDFQLSDRYYVTLVNIYAPNKASERKAFFNSVKHFCSKAEDPRIIAGDYNCVQNPLIDRKKSSNKNTADDGARELNDLISYLDLEDIWRRRNLSVNYTFCRNDSKSRIDYFLISKSIDNEIEKSNIIHFPYSDHDLITIVINSEQVERGPGIWKLNCSILQNETYI